jgi:inhibitor of cysteine peptidase
MVVGVGDTYMEDRVFRHHIHLISAFLLMLIPLACASMPNNPKSVKVTEEDDGNTVDLDIGDRLEITLDSNPTTGYQWETIGDISSHLRQLGESSYEPSGEGIGSGGKTVFIFEAIGAGQTRLELVYRQPFDKETPPTKTFDLTVIVNN